MSFRCTVLAAALLICLAPLACAAGDNDEEAPIGDSSERWSRAQALLRPACDDYLGTFTTQKERDKWNKRMTDRVKQRVTDGAPQNEQAIFQALALDWVAGSEGKLRKKDPGAIKIACLFFKRFMDEGIPPPTMMRQRLSLKDCREMVDILGNMVAEKRKQS
jgi:hypothetical protein